MAFIKLHYSDKNKSRKISFDYFSENTPETVHGKSILS